MLPLGDYTVISAGLFLNMDFSYLWGPLSIFYRLSMLVINDRFLFCVYFLILS